jgi:hypothetical protein
LVLERDDVAVAQAKDLADGVEEDSDAGWPLAEDGHAGDVIFVGDGWRQLKDGAQVDDGKDAATQVEESTQKLRGEGHLLDFDRWGRDLLEFGHLDGELVAREQEGSKDERDVLSLGLRLRRRFERRSLGGGRDS